MDLTTYIAFMYPMLGSTPVCFFIFQTFHSVLVVPFGIVKKKKKLLVDVGNRSTPTLFFIHLWIFLLSFPSVISFMKLILLCSFSCRLSKEIQVSFIQLSFFLPGRFLQIFAHAELSVSFLVVPLLFSGQKRAFFLVNWSSATMRVTAWCSDYYFFFVTLPNGFGKMFSRWILWWWWWWWIKDMQAAFLVSTESRNR